ncbi:TPA: 2-oxo acid dehydrogenase subunit E2 [bacterium]|nr:2-oxo acid dehydrogenase subunit E2 [bacterium]
MATTIVMPQLASTMENGTIVKWLKQVGEEIAEGEAIIEITTDKVDVEVESPASGVLLKILANEGDEIPVKQPVGVIGEAGEAITEIPETKETESKEAKDEVEIAKTDFQRPSGKVFASPRARRLAKEAGLDVSDVIGSGPNGRIMGKDVLKYAKEGKKPSSEPKPIPGEVIKLSPIQKMVAERLTMSYRTAPHIDLVIDVNCEKMIELRNFLKAQGVSVSYNDILAKFTAIALRQYPKLNSVFGEDGIHLMQDVNIGVAVAAGEDLVVPVVKNADKKTVIEIASDSARIIKLARDKKLSLDDLSGGTLTITNLGMFGIRSFKAIINPPQVAILAVGTIESRAIVIPGQIIAQQMMTLSLSVDHRAVNGAQAGEFLARLKELLEMASLDLLMNRPISL